MKIIWHLVKKDLRLLRPILALWWVTIALFTSVQFSEYINQRKHYTLYAIHNEIYVILECLVCALPFYLVANLVDVDSPLDDRALWRTLPLGGSRLFTAKITFLSVFGIIIPSLILFIEHYPYASMDEARVVLGGYVVLFTILSIILLLASSLFRKPIVGFGVFGAMLLLGVMIPLLFHVNILFSFYGCFTNYVSIFISVTTSLVTVACIYIQQRRRGAAEILLVGLALAFTIGFLWPNAGL